MSFEVTRDALAATVEGFAVAYLLTLGDRPRPHVGAVGTTVVDGVVQVRDVGRSALRDVAGHDAVTLLWAPRQAGDYSLIVDGTATVVGDRLDVQPGRAVLHRPASSTQPDPADGACGSDCVELPVDPPRSG
ncbi:hypothetical protein [Actinomycetospora flava]|uniref:Pyridoxamine 5'-phosphate oxidase n=1 Tax=Actinomycetospora flava TaxID=3129232 RepID=A0ABU8MEV4_9PSEU